MTRDWMRKQVKELFGDEYTLEYWNGFYRLVRNGHNKTFLLKPAMIAFLEGAKFMKEVLNVETK
jgi:hypothetical protein